MTTRQLSWLETHVEPSEEYYRDVPLKGLTPYLIDRDLEFLKEVWADWRD